MIPQWDHGYTRRDTISPEYARVGAQITKLDEFIQIGRQVEPLKQRTLGLDTTQAERALHPKEKDFLSIMEIASNLRYLAEQISNDGKTCPLIC